MLWDAVHPKAKDAESLLQGHTLLRHKQDSLVEWGHNAVALDFLVDSSLHLSKAGCRSVPHCQATLPSLNNQ